MTHLCRLELHDTGSKMRKYLIFHGMLHKCTLLNCRENLGLEIVQPVDIVSRVILVYRLSLDVSWKPQFVNHWYYLLEMSSSSPQAWRWAQNRARQGFCVTWARCCRAHNEQRNAKRIYRRAWCRAQIWMLGLCWAQPNLVRCRFGVGPGFRWDFDISTTYVHNAYLHRQRIIS